ncbi:hypothetical protein CO613_01760 [Lysobacteraceae bacterium NML07-0707]|nr:hypothetical protein CO613_01760 [Xanthomonadaceae bacterium NML07-0707]
MQSAQGLGKKFSHYSHAIAMTIANVTDRKGKLVELARCKPGLSRVQALLCDSDYAERPFAQGVQGIL